MPIEIRELVIKALIDESNIEKTVGSDSQTADREDIVAECVEQVMEILREKSER